MMAELSVFEPEKLTFVSPSPSKEDDIAQRTDSITVNCTADPDRNIMVLLTELGKQVEELKSEAERQKQDQNTEQRNLSKRVKELEKQNQDHIFEHNTGQQNLSKRVEELESRYRDHIFEQRNLRAQVSMLQPIARRILVDVYLSIKGYRPSSSGSRNNWISSNMGMLLPPRTGTTATAFELKLASYQRDGDTFAHSTQTLAIALAFDALPLDEDIRFMFFECFGHDAEDELNGKITSTLVEVGEDGLAHVTNTPSLVP